MSKAITNENLYEVIRQPLVTEKSTIQGEFNKVTFKVRTDSTKPQIKKAVESLFDVKVTNVNTINQQGKEKRFRGKIGKRSDYKKAIVTLAEGSNIDIAGGAN